MSLGTTILRLRSEKNMSQGDLADVLDVSRQSISKWETGGAVPELEKLVKLSQVFDVSLDELVLNVKSTPPPETPPTPPQPARSGLPARKIAGIVLLCMGFLVFLLITLMGQPLGGLIYASPFLLCGLLCMLIRRLCGLWCGWTVYLIGDIYIRYATGITWFLTLWTLRFKPEMNYVRLIIAWVMLLCALLLIAATAFCFRNDFLTLIGWRRNCFIGGWVLFALRCVMLPVLYALLLQGTRPYQHYSLVNFTADWATLFLLTVLLAATVRALRSRRAKKVG